jgi:hypothetical protein
MPYLQAAFSLLKAANIFRRRSVSTKLQGATSQKTVSSARQSNSQSVSSRALTQLSYFGLRFKLQRTISRSALPFLEGQTASTAELSLVLVPAQLGSHAYVCFHTPTTNRPQPRNQNLIKFTKGEANTCLPYFMSLNCAML